MAPVAGTLGSAQAPAGCSGGIALTPPRTTAFGGGAYPELWSKAAAPLQSVVKNHALVDGNQRLGWLATATVCLPELPSGR